MTAPVMAASTIQPSAPMDRTIAAKGETEGAPPPMVVLLAMMEHFGVKMGDGNDADQDHAL